MWWCVCWGGGQLDAVCCNSAHLPTVLQVAHVPVARLLEALQRSCSVLFNPAVSPPPFSLCGITIRPALPLPVQLGARKPLASPA